MSTACFIPSHPDEWPQTKRDQGSNGSEIHGTGGGAGQPCSVRTTTSIVRPPPIYAHFYTHTHTPARTHARTRAWHTAQRGYRHCTQQLWHGKERTESENHLVIVEAFGTDELAARVTEPVEAVQEVVLARLEQAALQQELLSRDCAARLRCRRSVHRYSEHNKNATHKKRVVHKNVRSS